jgi:hypothetical protein
MARTPRVDDSELLDNNYLNDMLGEQGEEGSFVDNEGDSNGETNADGTPKASKGAVGDGDDKSQVDPNDPANRTGKQPNGKQSGKDPTGQQQQQAKGGAPKDGKPQLTQPQLLEVYNTVKARMQPVINKLEMDNRKQGAQLKEYQARDQFLSQYKLNPKEHLNAVQLAVALRDKPVETIKFLLTQAQAAGHNITATGEANGGISPQALRQMIQSEIAPLTQRTLQENELQAAQQEAQEQLTAFYGSFPDARVHEESINELLQRYPDWNLETAYIRLKDFYHANGIDFSVPLRQAVGAARQQSQQQPRNGQRPMGVRGVNGQMQQQQDETQNQNGELPVADIGTSRKDIIKNAMRSAGMDISRLN